MQAVLMVAGKSTRTYPLTLTRPKPNLPIANKPLIQHSLDQLIGLFEEAVLIVGYRQEEIKHLLGDSYRGIKLVYQEQLEQLGTGHAVLQAKPWIREKFVAMNGDDLFAREDLERLVRLDYGALVKNVENPSLYGVYKVDRNNRVLDLVEKPKEYLGDLANIGCYVLQPSFFEVLEQTPFSERGEIEITSAVSAVAQERDFYTVAITGFWLPTGYAWDLLKHQEYIMASNSGSSVEGQIEEGVMVKGAVEIGAGTIVKSGTYLEGPVVIGRNCQIGPNCYVKSFSSIGDGCRIGQGVEIKNSIIMENTNICHLSYIGDSIVGQGCTLGAGTITANRRHDESEVKSVIKGELINTGRFKLGAIIGDGVQTGIHTSILPGRKLWPSTSTRPGEIIERDIVPPEAEWT
jgi:UDP-N-acetylglucosamine diphosphorylase/glucosamine-1-phosphate N-acetyltransferase